MLYSTMSTSQASDETIAKSTKRPNDEVDTPEKRQRRFTDALTRSLVFPPYKRRAPN